MNFRPVPGHTCCAGPVRWTRCSAAVQAAAFSLLMVWAITLGFLTGSTCCHAPGSQLALRGEEGRCYLPGHRSAASTVLQTTCPCGSDPSAPKLLQRTRPNMEEGVQRPDSLRCPAVLLQGCKVMHRSFAGALTLTLAVIKLHYVNNAL